MADKLIVRNFGPIKNAELDIKKTTVLIGPQGSGKSTLAKLVAYSLNIGDEFVERYFNNANKLNVENELAFFADYGLANYLQEDSIINYFGTEINLKNSDLTFASKTVKEKFDVISKKYDSNSSITKDNLDFERATELSKNMTQPVYIPSERNLFAIFSGIVFNLVFNKIPLPQSIVDLGANIEAARNQINGLQTVIKGVEYKNIDGRDHIVTQGKVIKLSESASGFQALIPLQLLVETFSNILHRQFLVEEPELNLYPTAQKHLIYYLAQKCIIGDNQLLLTTHSPYVLSSLNNLLFAYKVAQKHPEQAEEIAKIIPKESWLNPDDFAAYFVADGTVRSIVNPKTGLISENELDGVSEDIGDEFDALMEIYRTKNAKSH